MISKTLMISGSTGDRSCSITDDDTMYLDLHSYTSARGPGASSVCFDSQSIVFEPATPAHRPACSNCDVYSSLWALLINLPGLRKQELMNRPNLPHTVVHLIHELLACTCCCVSTKPPRQLPRIAQRTKSSLFSCSCPSGSPCADPTNCKTPQPPPHAGSPGCFRNRAQGLSP